MAPPPQSEGNATFSVGTCLVCEAPDPFGLAVCNRCLYENRGREHSTGILLHQPRSRQELDTTRGLLVEAFKLPTGSEVVSDVARGRKPLLLVPDELAQPVLTHLSAGSLRAYAIPQRYLWQCIPTRVFVTLIAIIAVHVLLGILVSVWVTVIGFGVAVALLASIYRTVTTPLLSPHVMESYFSPDIRDKIIRTTIKLSPGECRSRFVELVRASHRLLSLRRKNRSFHELELAADVNDLVSISCESAVDAFTLHQFLESTSDSEPEQDQLASRALCRDTKSNLLGHLRAATSSLERLCTEQIATSMEGPRSLKDLSAAMHAEVEAYSRVRREFEMLGE